MGIVTAQAPNRDPELNSFGIVHLAPDGRWRAGPLEVDPAARELRVAGARSTLQELPLRVLCLLLERGGRPVSRRELQARFWPHHDGENFERSLNTCMRKLRQAIGDDAREPRLIETLRAAGYRWIGPVPERLAEPRPPAAPAASPASAADPVSPAAAPPRSRRLRPSLVLTLVLAAAALGAVPALLPAPAAAPRLVLPADADADQRARLAAAVQARGGRLEIAVGAGATAALELPGAPAQDLPWRGNPDAVEEALVRWAQGTPAPSAAAAPTLTAALNQALVEATARVASGDRAAVLAAVPQLAEITGAVPDHAGAWLALARAEAALVVLDADEPAHRARSRSALHRALALDPRAGRSVLAMANFLHWIAWEPAAAARWYALAARALPDDPRRLHAQAWFELAQGRDADALAHVAAAAARDALDPELQSNWGWFFYRTGDAEAALRQCRVAAALPQAAASAAICQWRALHQLGRIDEAWQVLRASPPQGLPAADVAALDALPAAQAWRSAQARLAAWERRPGGSAYDAALAAVAAGEADAALDDLERSVARREPMARLIGATPDFAPLHGDPRYRRLLALARGEGTPAARVQ